MSINFKWLTNPILSLLRYHKLKILVTLISAVFFFILLFPFSDLSLFISDIIAKNTRNQVILQFEDLTLKFLPSPGFQMSQIVVNTPFVSGLKVEDMTLMPTLSSLFGQFGMTAQLNGVMGGHLNVFVKILEENDQGEPKLDTQIRTQNISIQEVLKNTPYNFNINGNLYLQGEGQWDLSFEGQPNFRLRTQTQNFQLQALSVPTPIGPFPLPALSVREILIRVNLTEGQLQVENLEVGRQGDDLVGQVNGFVDLQFRKGINGPQILPGRYNLACRLTLQSNLEDQFKALIDISNLARHKKDNTYSFRVIGTPGQIPSVRGL